MDIGTIFVKYCLCLFNFAFVVSLSPTQAHGPWLKSTFGKDIHLSVYPWNTQFQTPAKLSDLRAPNNSLIRTFYLNTHKYVPINRLLKANKVFVLTKWDLGAYVDSAETFMQFLSR